MKSMRLIAECVLVAMAVLCAVSCEKETDSLDEIISGAVTDTIVHNSGDRIALTFGGSASSDAVAVTGSGAWSVTGETSWCKATLAYKNGKTVVVVSVTENEQHESREAELMVSLGDAKYTIAVRQGGKEYRLDYNGGEVQIPIAGGRIWQVSGATDWCRVSIEYKSDASIVTAQVSAHSGETDRETTLTLTSGDERIAVRIVQKRIVYNISLLETERVEFAARNASATYTVSSNAAWRVSDTPDWCSVAPKSGNNGTKITISVTNNTGDDSREAVVVLTCGDSECRIPVLQTFIVRGVPVDLGLSVMWADRNLGAASSGERGDCYAWGETETKEDYEPKNYTFYKGDIDGDGHLSIAEFDFPATEISGTEYDAARVQWGGKWRMPTYEEINELFEKCTEDRRGTGWNFIAPNGARIFLPCYNIDYWSGSLISGEFDANTIQIEKEEWIYPLPVYDDEGRFLYIVDDYRIDYYCKIRSRSVRAQNLIRPVMDY